MARYILFLAVVLLFHGDVQSKKSRYSVNTEYIWQCPEPEYTNLESPVEDIQIYKINRTVKAFSFSITLKRPWDADVGFKMELEIWAYAGWTRLPYIPMQPDLCKTMKTMFRNSTTDIIKDFGNKEECPLPPGRYVFRNFTSSFFGRNLPFPGRFRVRTVVLTVTTKRPILCAMAILNVEEKLSA